MSSLSSEICGDSSNNRGVELPSTSQSESFEEFYTEVSTIYNNSAITVIYSLSVSV